MVLEWAFWIKMLMKLNGRFEGTYHFRLQDRRISQTTNQHEACSKQSKLHLEKYSII
jgi:hypothetical protein